MYINILPVLFCVCHISIQLQYKSHDIKLCTILQIITSQLGGHESEQTLESLSLLLLLFIKVRRAMLLLLSPDFRNLYIFASHVCYIHTSPMVTTCT